MIPFQQKYSHERIVPEALKEKKLIDVPPAQPGKITTFKLRENTGKT